MLFYLNRRGYNYMGEVPLISCFEPYTDSPMLFSSMIVTAIDSIMHPILFQDVCYHHYTG